MIESLYDELLQFDLTYPEMYDMTVGELMSVLTQRRKGLAYRMWRQAMMSAWAVMGKDYPNKPEEALPELYPTPKKYEMPDFLREKWLERGGRHG